jgi:sigma-E factor negative regulatory protein RseB
MSAAALVLAAMLLASPARATPPSPDTRPDTSTDRKSAGSEAAAVRLIERASTADATTAYEGTQFVASWGSRSSSHLLRVRNEPGSGMTVHMLGTGKGPAPAARPERSAVSALDNADALDLLTSNYHVLTAGRDSVAGREADVIDAWRHPDDGRAYPMARFWLDRETGVLLRRESYDATGRTVRGSAYFTIEVEPEPLAGAVTSPGPPEFAVPLRADGRQLSEKDLSVMESAGWICPRRLSHGLELREARRLDDAGGEVIHLAYSDGLATVSVFQQRGRLDNAGLTGFRQVRLGGGTVHVRDGVPAQLIWMSRDTVFTIVTDAPDETVATVVAALPSAEPSDTGLLARLARGFSRAAAWVMST